MKRGKPRIKLVLGKYSRRLYLKGILIKYYRSASKNLKRDYDR